MNKYDRAHLRNIKGYQNQIERFYRDIIIQAVSLGGGITSLGDDIFSFESHPELRKRVQSLLSAYQKGIYGVIVNGINAEWTLANNKNSELSRQVFGDKVGRLTQAQYRRYFSTNDAARQAFIARKEGGLNLSDRVWKYTNQFKSEIELGLDVGIRSGQSAAEMARDLKQFLQQPDKLFRRVRDEHGDLQLSKAAEAYHSGQGVYRSSYKNARRLAATETNIAYRASDYERWQQLDFVVGIEIKLSNNHTTHNSKGQLVPLTDICDELAGKYPKDFKFTGWHPHCRCFTTTILKTQEELEADTEKILNGEPLDGESVNAVTEVPEEFKAWVTDNEERIKNARSMPYFLSDNESRYLPYVNGTYFAHKGGDIEITDDIKDLYMSPKTFDKLKEIEKIQTFNDAKKYFADRGISLLSDSTAIEEKANEIIPRVKEGVQKLATAVNAYEDMFGKQCLAKLKAIKFYDKSLLEQAAYHYNAVGEIDKLAGTIRFSNWSPDLRSVFHELAHCIQDSFALRGEDAVIFANRIAKEVKAPMLKAYTGAAGDVINAENMADTIALAFTRGSKKGMKFIESFLEYMKHNR